MNQPTNRDRQQLPIVIATGIAFAAALSGCALTTDHIRVDYNAPGISQRIAGADNVRVQVSVRDTRSTPQRVSAKKNGYGMEMADIVADNDIAETLANGIQAELASRGFVVAAGPLVVNVELRKFYSDFKTGWFSGSAVAELLMDVQVKKPDGAIVYSKLVTGEGTVPSLQVASGSNAKLALDGALDDAVANLFKDPEFVSALLKANNTAHAS